MSVKIWDKTNGEALPLVTAKEGDDIYSTTETKTNKVWIDGKPIYRKVIVTKGSSFTISDCGTVTFAFWAQATNNDAGQVCYIYNYDGSSTSGIRRDRPTSETFAVISTVAFASCEMTIVIEYTKTTD